MPYFVETCKHSQCIRGMEFSSNYQTDSKIVNKFILLTSNARCPIFYHLKESSYLIPVKLTEENGLMTTLMKVFSTLHLTKCMFYKKCITISIST